EPEGSPAAVLIRALDPLEGTELMCRRRGLPAGSANDDRRAGLCRGPGNLTVALAIGRTRNLADLTSSVLRIEDRGIKAPAVTWSPRIGIRVGTDRPWRVSWARHHAVSGQRAG